MFKILSRADRVNEHRWFAWYPVLATTKWNNGLTYSWVWLKTVRRKFIRAANMGQWSYELPA